VAVPQIQLVKPPADACPSCAALVWQIHELESEREALLRALGEERERSNSLFVGYPSQALPQVVADEKPLRYQLVDKLNETIKTRIPPSVFRAVRGTVARLRGH
jgi:hypothetical protein